MSSNKARAWCFQGFKEVFGFALGRVWPMGRTGLTCTPLACLLEDVPLAAVSSLLHHTSFLLVTLSVQVRCDNPDPGRKENDLGFASTTLALPPRPAWWPAACTADVLSADGPVLAVSIPFSPFFS